MLYVRKKKINISSLISLFIFLEPGRKKYIETELEQSSGMRYASELIRLFLQPSSSKCFSSFGFCFLSCITRTWVGFEKWQISSCSRRKQKAKYLFQLIPSSFSLRPASVINQLPNPDLNSAWKRCRKLASGSKQSKFKNLQTTVQAAGSLS